MLRPMPFVAPTKTTTGFGDLMSREALLSVIISRATMLIFISGLQKVFVVLYFE